MTMSVPFDTLDYAKKLESTGMPVAQAEQQSKVLADVLGRAVAFPHDLLTLEKNLTSKIETSELKLENKLATLAGEITTGKWMLTTLIGINLAIMLKLFLK